jgi:apolipoprotein N-acyltransferase
VLYGEVQPMQQLTPYLRWQGWPLWLLSALLIGWALLASRMAKTL